MLRFVALLHFISSALLLSGAALLASSALRVQPHLSSGTPLTKTLVVVFVAMTAAGPWAALGFGMAVLGWMAWTRKARVREALLWTHGPLLLVGLLACSIGIAGMQAAERSAERGGGLLGPVAVVPLLVGVPIVALALCAIVAALMLPRRVEDSAPKTEMGR